MGLAAGTVGWMDLTVTDADTVRDFYQQVTGWTPSPVSMGDYQDYCMIPPGGSQPVSGICHARGGNTGLPAVWLIYITVADLDESVRQCLARGGQILHGPKNMGKARYCIIQDPAGAAVGLYENPRESGAG